MESNHTTRKSIQMIRNYKHNTISRAYIKYSNHASPIQHTAGGRVGRVPQSTPERGVSSGGATPTRPSTPTRLPRERDRAQRRRPPPLICAGGTWRGPGGGGSATA